MEAQSLSQICGDSGAETIDLRFRIRLTGIDMGMRLYTFL